MPRPPGKMAIARQIILQDPQLSPDVVLLKMKKKNITMSINSIRRVRYLIRKEGGKLPFLPEGRAKGSVKLGGKIATIMKEIYLDPRASVEEIKKKLAEKKVNADIESIYRFKREMKKYFSDTEFSKRPKPIHLTEKQKEMIPAFQRVIGWAIFQHLSPRLHWSAEKLRDFEEFVGGQLPSLITNYDEKRGTLSTYIVNKLGFLSKDYIRSNLMTKMGITGKETRLLIKIIREKSQGLQDNKKIAKKLGCPQQKVDELWQAYKDFHRINNRLGNREKER